MSDMPNTRTLNRRKAKLPMDRVRKLVTEWLNLDNMASQFGAQANEAKVNLRDTVLVEQGEEDDLGNSWINFGNDPIVDPSGKGVVTAIKREKRSPKTLLADKAEALLKRKKLWDKCTEVITVINEDAILAAAFEGDITEAELNSLYEVKEIFAFVPQRKK